MWRELFPKVLKWDISAFFFILGIYFLALVEQGGHVGPLILALFSFGIVYWQYKKSDKMPWQVALASALVLAASWAAARYISLDYGVFGFGFYPAWTAWTIFLGTPVIAFAHQKYS